MSNYLLVGTSGANAVVGTADAGYNAIGTIVSAERKDSSDQLELKDRYGNVVVVIYFNYKNECTIDVIFDSTVSLPAIGDALSVCGLTIVLVDTITLKWEQGKEKMVTIKATRRANLVTS